MGKLSGMNCRREKAGLPVDDEQEYLPLSWLSQADYCLRRAALLLNEQEAEQLTYRHSVFDNSYVKLRELTIGYQFPEKMISKLGLGRLSVSVFGRNLFYFYKALKNYDAESSVGTSWANQATVGSSTTATRSFGVSLRASF